jgi:hypothetical protein
MSRRDKLAAAAIGGIGHHMGKKHEQKAEGGTKCSACLFFSSDFVIEAQHIAAQQNQAIYGKQVVSPPPVPAYYPRNATAPLLSPALLRSWRSFYDLPHHCSDNSTTFLSQHALKRCSEFQIRCLPLQFFSNPLSFILHKLESCTTDVGCAAP